MKSFAYHVILERGNICNYLKEQEFLNREVLKGQRILLTGRRNTGKTSLIQSIVIPAFRKAHKDGFVIFADLMGVRNLEQVTDRLRVAFQEGFQTSFPKKPTFDSMVGLIKGLRPQLSVDPLTGELSLSLGRSKEEPPALEDLFKEISKIHSKTKALIILDEFQDISLVEQAEAKLRNTLQKLPSDLSVIVLGSKKHLLARMFSNPSSPFAGWGIPVELPPISANDYQKYINERFAEKGLTISIESTRLLLDRLQQIPECVNLVCYMILQNETNPGPVTPEKIHEGIRTALHHFRANFNEFLSKLTTSEEDFLIALAKNQPVLKPSGHEFTKQLKSSETGARKILQRLEDQAAVYRTDEGYVVADPLLALFLVENR